MTRRTADILGGLILCAYGVALSGYPAMAQTVCHTPAAFAAPGLHLLGFAKGDARAFLTTLADIAPNPMPPAIAAAALVVAYVGDDGADATIRFFDANGCALGLWTTMPLAVLHYIDQQIGTPA